MRFLTTLPIIIFMALGLNNATAQKVKSKATIVIQTSAQCDMCKERIEKGMAYTKGVVSSSLNVGQASLKVVYRTHKTSPEKIRKVISELGYDADTILANKKAYYELPSCCQKGGMEH